MYEFPEDCTVVPKRVGVIQDCSTLYAVCALFGLVKENNLNNKSVRSVDGNSSGIFSDSIWECPEELRKAVTNLTVLCLRT